MNTLNVYLKQDNQLGGPRWSRTRNQGNVWIRGELKIETLTSPYQIVFEGIAGIYQGVRDHKYIFCIEYKYKFHSNAIKDNRFGRYSSFTKLPS